MWDYLRRLLAHLWQRMGSVREALGRRAAEEDPIEEELQTEARARFWAAVREGQREAEANSRRNP
jgi:hypothetical protein